MGAEGGLGTGGRGVLTIEVFFEAAAAEFEATITAAEVVTFCFMVAKRSTRWVWSGKRSAEATFLCVSNAVSRTETCSLIRACSLAT